MGRNISAYKYTNVTSEDRIKSPTQTWVKCKSNTIPSAFIFFALTETAREWPREMEDLLRMGAEDSIEGESTVDTHDYSNVS